MAYNEFPKTFYRYDEKGERVGKTYACAEDVEGGWVSIDELGPPPDVKAALPQSGAQAVEAGKRLVAAEEANAHLKNTVKLYEDMVAAIIAHEECAPAIADLVQARLTPPAAKPKPAPKPAKAAAEKRADKSQKDKAA